MLPVELLDKTRLKKIIEKVEKQEQIFSEMALFDTTNFTGEIVGREKQTEELVSYLLRYSRGFVVPLISVYGRSGSGKSAVTKFVCENFDAASHCMVNLRKAKSVFGAANLILSGLGQPSTKSSLGLDSAIDRIGNSIEEILQKDKKQLFVLVLDEIDVIFNDKRGSPSDFFYKLIILGENLRKHDHLLCVITISNNLFSDNNLDDRVLSRIGTSEVFFEPYSQKMVLEILMRLSLKCFSKKIDEAVLERCAELSSAEHGDARRAIELLRVSAELAVESSVKISPEHVKLALKKLSTHKANNYFSHITTHQKYICLAIGKMTYILRESLHSTSAIQRIYRNMLPSSIKPLSYRRASDLLNELEQDGILISQSISKGRYGFGKNYKLTFMPDFLLSLFPQETVEWKELRDKVLDYKLNQYSISRNKDAKFHNEMGLLGLQGLI